MGAKNGRKNVIKQTSWLNVRVKDFNRLKTGCGFAFSFQYQHHNCTLHSLCSLCKDTLCGFSIELQHNEKGNVNDLTQSLMHLYGVAALCSFQFPLITVCAFEVMSIRLKLKYRIISNDSFRNVAVFWFPLS